MNYVVFQDKHLLSRYISKGAGEHTPHNNQRNYLYVWYNQLQHNCHKDSISAVLAFLYLEI